MHEQQSRDALNALSTKRDKFNEYRKTIDDTGPARPTEILPVWRRRSMQASTNSRPLLIASWAERAKSERPQPPTALDGLTTAATKRTRFLGKAFGKGPVAQGRTQRRDDAAPSRDERLGA